MVSRLWTVGLAVALAAWTTSCERHSWSKVSELHRGHHGAHEEHADHAGDGAGHAPTDPHGETKKDDHGAAHPEPAAKPKAH